MLFSDISILDENFDYKEHQFVGVIDDKIVYVGSDDPREKAEATDFGKTYDGKDRLLIPGLYNLHAHAPMTLLRGYAENVPLQQWLNDLVWPFEDKMDADDNYWATLLSCAEMASYGVVSYSDMYYHSERRAQATTEVGMKANICEGLLAFEPKPFNEYPQYEQNKELMAKLNNSDEGRIKFDYCIHAEYTSNPITCKGVAEAAKDAGAMIHVHVSETKSEHEECKERHDGMTPIQYFESIGVLDVPVLAAHCVWVEDEDIEIMAKHGVSVCHNPASNMKLASGFAPITKFFDSGVNVCLGTDGMASNNNHDMFADMYLMALINKGNLLDPTAVSPKQTIYAATRGGAIAQGRMDCGLIKEGFKADIAVVDISGASWCPQTDMVGNLVYAGHGSDVVMTLCDGRIIYQDGKVLGADVEKAKSEVINRVQRIKDSL